MSSSGYYKQGKKLEEGNNYSFKYVKLATLSDNNEYMILEDQFGIRHTIPYDYYRKYNMVLDSMIECKVEKINCTGRVFLEPKHPVYKEGEEFIFFMSSIVETNGGYTASLIDCFGNIIKADIKERGEINDHNNEKLKARIIKITRGLPEVEVLFC
jgi:hypothetical protein